MKLSGFFIFTSLFAIPHTISVAQAQQRASLVEVSRPKLTSNYEEDAPAVTRGIASVTSADVTESKREEIFLKCVKQAELRWLRLYRLAGGKCKTVYSKGGKAEEVSTASNYQACENVLKNVKKNLESGGYVCEERTLVGSLDLD